MQSHPLMIPDLVFEVLKYLHTDQTPIPGYMNRQPLLFGSRKYMKIRKMQYMRRRKLRAIERRDNVAAAKSLRAITVGISRIYGPKYIWTEVGATFGRVWHQYVIFANDALFRTVYMRESERVKAEDDRIMERIKADYVHVRRQHQLTLSMLYQIMYPALRYSN